MFACSTININLPLLLCYVVFPVEPVISSYMHVFIAPLLTLMFDCVKSRVIKLPDGKSDYEYSKLAFLYVIIICTYRGMLSC